MSKGPVDVPPAGVVAQPCDGHDPGTGELCEAYGGISFAPPGMFMPPKNMKLYACPDHREQVETKWKGRWK